MAQEITFDCDFVVEEVECNVISRLLKEYKVKQWKKNILEIILDAKSGNISGELKT